MLVKLANFSTVSEAEMIKELLGRKEIATMLTGKFDPIGAAGLAVSVTLLVDNEKLSFAKEHYETYFTGDGSGEPYHPADSC